MQTEDLERSWAGGRPSPQVMVQAASVASRLPAQEEEGRGADENRAGRPERREEGDGGKGAQGWKDQR